MPLLFCGRVKRRPVEPAVILDLQRISRDHDLRIAYRILQCLLIVFHGPSVTQRRIEFFRAIACHDEKNRDLPNIVAMRLFPVSEGLEDQALIDCPEPGRGIALPKLTSTQMVSLSLRVLCAIRERPRCVRQHQATVEEKVEDLRLVNRAKRLLIECLHMTEPDAHRYIIRQVMEERASKREIAESIIRTYQ